jgi:hypothetical protein
VAGATRAGVANTLDAMGALAKSAPTDIDGPVAPTAVAASGLSTGGGNFQVFADGSFTYVPAAGFTGVDSFLIAVTDTLDTSNLTVNITVSEMVWYVRDLVDANNAAGGDGRSNNAFESLAAAESASGVNHTVFVFRGNSGTTPLPGGITLKNGQKLHGEGIGLTLPTHGNLVVAGTQPRITNAGGNGVTVLANTANGDRTGVEIRGLSIGGNTNAIDASTANANNLGILISNNVIENAGQEGIDINQASTGAATLAIANNTLTATGNAIDIVRTNGAATITTFNDNVISGTSAAGGIIISGPLTFDATPGGAYNSVAGGVTTVGSSGVGNGVGTNGVVMTNISGDLTFTDLDVFVDNGSAVTISGTGVVNVGAGTGTRVTIAAGVGSMGAVNGPALALVNLTADMQLGSLSSSNSTSSGVSLVNVSDGTTNAIVSAGSSSTISNAGGTDFLIDGGNAMVSYAGTISDASGAVVSVINTTSDTKTFSGAISSGVVSLNNNTGATINFSGGLALNTGTSAAFTATAGGTVNVTGTNTVATTTGTAINIANTTIGASNVTFRSITSNGAASGIVLNNTGSSGGLVVSGNGGACTLATPICTGGRIQSSTAPGIRLINTRAVNLSQMRVDSGTDDGINGSNVHGLSLTNVVVQNNGNSGTDEGIEIVDFDQALVFNGLAVIGSSHNNVYVYDTNNTGGNGTVTISNTSILSNSVVSGNSGMILELANGAVWGASSISNSTFNDNEVLGLHVIAGDNSNLSDLTIQSSTFSDTSQGVGGTTSQEVGMSIDKSGTAAMTVKVLNNTLIGHNIQAMNFFTGAGAGTTGIYNARIENNTIGNVAIAGSGSIIGNGIRVNINGDADASVLLNGNVIRQTPNGRGIEVISRNGIGGADVTITNNNVNPNDTTGFPLAAIFAQSNALAIGNTLRTLVSGNTVPAGVAFDILTTSITVVETGASTCEVVGAGANPTAVLTANNTGSASASAGCTLIAGPITSPP